MEFEGPLAAHPEKRLAEQVAGRLRQAIVTGQLSPKARLTERDLTSSLGVSRTPIREALRRLEHDGLIVGYPHRGYFVRSPSFEEARQAYEARKVLEGACAGLAASRADELDIAGMRQALRKGAEALAAGDTVTVLVHNNEFHGLQARAARNAFLQKQWTGVWTFVDLLRGVWWSQSPRPTVGHAEHEALLAAIERRDSHEAERIAAEHVERAWQNIAKRFESQVPASTASIGLARVNPAASATTGSSYDENKATDAS